MASQAVDRARGIALRRPRTNEDCVAGDTGGWRGKHALTEVTY